MSDYWLSLPIDIIMLIIRELPARSIAALGGVSKFYYNAVRVYVGRLRRDFYPGIVLEKVNDMLAPIEMGSGRISDIRSYAAMYPKGHAVIRELIDRSMLIMSTDCTDRKYDIIAGTIAGHGTAMRQLLTPRGVAMFEVHLVSGVKHVLPQNRGELDTQLLRCINSCEDRQHRRVQLYIHMHQAHIRIVRVGPAGESVENLRPVNYGILYLNDIGGTNIMI